MKNKNWFGKWKKCLGLQLSLSPLDHGGRSRTQPNLETLEDRYTPTVSLIKDINVGVGASNPSSFTNVNGTLFFSAKDDASGVELWKSDGTQPGTVRVKDIRSGSGSSSPSLLTNVNGTLYFTATDGANGRELWKSDGTEAGTIRVKDIQTGPFGSYPSGLTNLNGTLFFSATDGGQNYELWKSDGTESGTVKVKEIASGSFGSYPSGLTNASGVLFFSAQDSAKGAELWKSDGTEAGTIRVRDINQGTYSSYPSSVTNANGNVYFSAKSDRGLGHDLWKSDGTESGTIKIKDFFYNGPGSYPGYLTNIKGTVFFRADDGVSGNELWKTDGTEAGTIRVKDINPGDGNSYPFGLSPVDGVLYFRARDGSGDMELWKSDGTENGTIRVKDINPGLGSSNPRSLTNVNGALFFSADDGKNGTELWTSDGTEAGTVLVEDILPGAASSNPKQLAALGDRLFFAATTPNEGEEFWGYQDTIVFTSSVSTKFTVGIQGSFTVSAKGQPTPQYAITSGNLPSGLTFNETTGVLSGTPQKGTGGIYNLGITASNGKSLPDTQTFTLGVNQSSEITSESSATFIVGTAGSFPFAATGFPEPTYSISAGTLPAGLTLDPTTGLLSGSPAPGTGGIYNLVITASNGVGAAASQNFTLMINQAPVITSGATANFTVGSFGSFKVTGTGFPAPTYSVSSGVLPNGLSLDPTTGTLSGTPALNSPEVNQLVITASNGIGSAATQNLTIVVEKALRVESIAVAEGQIQRSKVSKITVRFSKEVTLAPGAFTVVKSVGGAPVGKLTVATALVDGKTVATLAFSGFNTTNGSLANGAWTLKIDANKVTDPSPLKLTLGDNPTHSFFRLEGDLDGNGRLTVNDSNLLVSQLGKKVTPSDPLSAYDFNGDGTIGSSDAFFLRRLLGRQTRRP